MSEDEEEFIEGISSAYRFRVSTQATMYILVMLLIVILFDVYNIVWEARITSIAVLAALLFPLFVKERNRLSRGVSLGLFCSAMTLMIWYAYLFAFFVWPPTQTTLLLVAGMLAVAIILFEYLIPTGLKRNAFGYSFVTIVGIVFSILTTMAFGFLPPYGVFNIWSIVLSMLVFMVFVYATIPERPL